MLKNTLFELFDFINRRKMAFMYGEILFEVRVFKWFLSLIPAETRKPDG